MRHFSSGAPEDHGAYLAGHAGEAPGSVPGGGRAGCFSQPIGAPTALHTHTMALSELHLFSAPPLLQGHPALCCPTYGTCRLCGLEKFALTLLSLGFLRMTTQRLGCSRTSTSRSVALNRGALPDSSPPFWERNRTVNGASVSPCIPKMDGQKGRCLYAYMDG